MSDTAPAARADRNAVLGALWLFVLLNYIYCDVIALQDPAMLSSVLEGVEDDTQFTPAFLLVSSVLIEIPIVLTLVARIAPRKAARIASIIGAGFMVFVQVASLSLGTPSPSYVFFSLIEIAALVAIIVVAIRWSGRAAALTS